MDRGLPAELGRFVNRIVSRLGRCELDYAPLPSSGDTGPVLPAGVLFLLSFRAGPSPPGPDGGEFVLHLIKRSATVAQGGDLSCPGGILDLRRDPVARCVLPRLFPIIPPAVNRELARRDTATRRAVLLFLANALRESWEEVRLRPWQVRFLGALPPYSLLLLKRRIFPVVGLLDGTWRPRINAEVERIVEIPLRAFFNPANYAWFDFSLPDRVSDRSGMPAEFPCLVYREADGRQEVLWGATFNITMTFLKIVADFERPAIAPDRVVRRTLPPGYLQGRNRS
jgi:8-oxo-dGTP pyrophosphatase MutT (NUDIX family)